MLFFPGRDQYYSRLFFYGFVVPGAPEGSTGRLIFVVVLGEACDRTCDPWFTRRVT